MKTCRVCGQTKPLEAFSKNRRSKDGLDRKCRICNRAGAKKWAEENPTRYKVNQLRWRTENADYKARKDKEWREANRDRCIEVGQAWAEANAEKVNGYKRAWEGRNRGTLRAKGRERWRRLREQDPESVREQQRRWRRENPKRVRELNRKYRFRADEEAVAYMAVLENDVCSYCAGPVKHMDHIVPRSSGGAHGWDNFTAACTSCNTSKHAKSLLVFLAER